MSYAKFFHVESDDPSEAGQALRKAQDFFPELDLGLRMGDNSRGNGEVIRLLRAAGADPLAKNAHGNSPLNLARTIASYDVRQYFSDLPDGDDGGGAAPDRGSPTE